MIFQLSNYFFYRFRLQLKIIDIYLRLDFQDGLFV
jgi:hypothetical protein